MISLNSFKDICRTDKFNDWQWTGIPGQGHNYVDMFYDTICAPMREIATAVLEIGIYKGHSHLLWDMYFTKAKIYGIDISPNPYPNHNKTILYGHTDAYSTFTVQWFKGLEPDGYDLIVDDGPHIYNTQLFCFQNYWDLVKRNGYLVIEDVVSTEAADSFVRMAKSVRGTTVHTFHSPASSPGNDTYALVFMKL